MTDRELLELAAKAAGIKGRYANLDEFPGWMTLHDGEGIYYTSSQAWNPLTDDGDALRLAVKLHIDFKTYQTTVRTWIGDPKAQKVLASIEELCGDDPYAATRRAIVRAAAEIAARL